MRSLVERYQRLLTGNETQRSLTETLRLADDLIAHGSKDVGSRTNGHAGDVMTQTAIAADVSERLTRLNHSAVPASLFSLVRKTVEALLVAPRIANDLVADSRQASFLLDVCQLVFHQSYCVLLPKLEKASPAVFEELLTVMLGFARDVTDPADRAHLLGRCYESRSDWERAAECHAAAVRATASNEDNFMTLLQANWMFLLDRGRISDALNVLLEAYPRVCRADLDEMGELIRTTFEIQQQERHEAAV